MVIIVQANSLYVVYTTKGRSVAQTVLCFIIPYLIQEHLDIKCNRGIRWGEIKKKNNFTK